MNRCSFCEWIPILPWPIWPLAGQLLLGQNVVVGSMTLLLAVRGKHCHEKYVWTPVCLTTALHHGLVWSYRQAQWGLQTLNYLEAKEREHSPEATALAQALRGLKSFKLFLMTLARNTTCLNEVMKMVKTQGLSAASIQACQERLGDLPVRSPIRKEVSHYLEHYLPIVALSESPLLGSSDVIESLIGKAKQRLEANGRNELNKSILLIPCMCGELTQDLVAEALSTVSVQDITPWVSENVGETMLSVRRRELGRRQPPKPGIETAEPLADTG